MLAAGASADTWTGLGADANWHTDANWLDGNKPVPPELLIFGGNTQTSNNNNFTAGTQFNGISFAAGAGSFTLGGNSILLGIPLTGTPATGDIVNNSTNAQTISLPITLGSGRHNITTATGAGALNLNGAITRGDAAAAVFTTSGGAINLTGSGLANNASGIIGGWTTLGNTDWAALDGGNNVVAYTGYTNVAPGGTIASDTNQNIKVATQGANITMAAAGTTDINTLLYSGATTGVTAAQVVDVGTGNTLRFGTSGGIFRTTNTAAGSITIGVNTATGGTITAGGSTIDTPGEIVFNTGAGSGGSQVININSNIADNGTGAVRLIKTGAGSMAINSVGNTYSGGTYILEGRVNPGTTGSGAFGSGNVHVYSGGTIFGSGATHANNFSIGSLGWATETGIGALRGGTYNGTVTLIGDAGISGNSAMNGQITGNFNLVVGATTNIASTPSLNNPSNNYTGNTTIVGRTGGTAGATTLTLGASEVIPHGAGKGNLIIGNASNTASDTILNLNGQTETVNGLVSAGTAARGFVQNNAVATAATLVVGANDATASYAATIRDNAGTGGTVAVTKTGTGTQTLSGTLSYTGATTVNAGRLNINSSLPSSAVTVNSGGTLGGSGSVAGAVTVNNGGGLAGGGGGVTSSLTLNGPVTVGAGSGDLATLTLSPNSLNPSTGAILASNTFTLNGDPNSVTVNVAAAAAVGTYTLLDYTGALGGTGFAAFTLGTTPRLVATLVDNAGNTSVDLNVTSVDFPIWSGALSSEWSTATLAAPKNWVLNSNNATTTDYIEGDQVVFNDFAANNSVTLNVADVSPFSVTFNNAMDSYVLSGTKRIVGTASLTKNGAGSLTINNTNAYTGGTVLNAGTLNIGVNNALGTGRLTLTGGTIDNTSAGAMTLAGNIPQTWGGTFTFAGTQNLNLGTGGVLLDNGANVNVAAATLTVGGVLSNNGGNSLTKSGAGHLVLNGASTYTGLTNINAGIVTVGSANGTSTSSLGAIPAVPAADVHVASGAVLNFGGAAAANGLNFGPKRFHISGDGGGLGVLTNSDFGADPTGNTGDLNQTNVLQQVILEADSTVRTQASATDHGFTSTAGRIDIRATQVGGFNVASLNLNGFDLTKTGNGFFGLVNVDVLGSGDITSATAGGIFTLEGTTAIADDGTSRIRIADSSMLQFWALNGETTMMRKIIMGDGTPTSSTFLAGGGGANANSLVGADIELRSNVTIRPTNANNNNSHITLFGDVTEDATPRKIIKANVAGILTLAGNNSFTGGVDINAGVINVATPPATTGTATVALGSATALHPSTVVSFGPVTGFTSRLQLNGNNATVAGIQVTDTAGTSTIENGGVAAATLTVNNTAAYSFSGNMQDGAGGGTLSLAKSGSGTLTLTGANSYTGGTTVSGGTLQGDTVGLQGTIANNAAVVFDQATDGTYAGVMSGTGSLTKNGAGNVTMSAANTYTGATTVNAGTLSSTNGFKTGNVLTVADGAKAVVPSAAPDSYDGGANIPSGNDATGSLISSLNLNASGQLDLGNSDMAINHDGSLPIATIAALVASGYNGGTWDGPGIIASSSLLDPTVFGLGYAENGDPEAIPDPYNDTDHLFFGIPVDSTSVLLKFTWLGDLNLDGFVNFSDLVVFNGEFDDGATTGRFWYEGDFDYDGDVDFSDLVIFNGAYDENKASMPEPGAMSVLAAAAGIGALRRRRRRREGAEK